MKRLLRRIAASASEAPPNAIHAVAYSGGVDSTVVAAALYRVVADPRRVVACLGVSPSLAPVQRDAARDTASAVGVTLMEIPTEEHVHPTYIENRGQSCYICKNHLYTALTSISTHFSTTRSSAEVVLYNGTNADDRSDPTRLGLVAAAEHRVVSPLDHATKMEVRRIARSLNLPNADAAASPCLRSRLALGVEATRAHLDRVARAEKLARERLDLDPTRTLRVRLLPGGRAAVELDDPECVARASEDETIADFFRQEGLGSVECRLYKYGAVSGQSGSD
eukprot:g306.t1